MKKHERGNGGFYNYPCFDFLYRYGGDFRKKKYVGLDLCLLVCAFPEELCGYIGGEIMIAIETKPFELMPDGKMLFPSWDKAIEYIEKYIKTNFRAVKREDGKAEVELFEK